LTTPGVVHYQAAIRNGATGFLVVLTAIALALRLAHVANVAAYERAHVVPGLDRWLDMEIADAVAGGDVLGGPLAPYDSAPAYGVLLGLAYRVFGRESAGPLVVQALLGAMVPLLLYAAGRRLASARVGLAAAALGAVYAPAIFYEGLTVKFALVPFAFAALLWALAAGAAVAAGAATALAVALRPNAIVALPLGLVWIASRSEARSATRTILLFAMGLVVVAAPLALRRSLSAERGDAASLWGIHFYVGSQPRGDGGYAQVVGVSDDVFGHVDDARAVAEASRGRPLTPGEVSRYWFGRGIDEITRDPTAYVRLLGRKVRRIVAPGEENDFGDEWAEYAARSAALRAGIGFGTVAPLAALGLLIAVTRRSALLWSAALAAAYVVTLLLFFVTGRYRLPLVPPFLLLAGAGLVWLADLWTTRRPVALAVAAVLVAGAAALGVPASDLVRLTILAVAAVVLVPPVRAPG
jgi:hypothetical protein